MFVEAARFEAEDLGTRFRIPMYCFQGEHDVNSPTALAREYFEKIRAPRKAFHVIPGAGHNTVAFHDELLALLESEVRPHLAR
jgi:pimeloyl-ACP methyl ester carboxylesterase